MKDEEKARKLIEEIYPSKSLGDYGLKEQLLLKAMEWKQQQMIEKAVEWVCLNAELYGGFNTMQLNIMVEQFKKAMEE